MAARAATTETSCSARSCSMPCAGTGAGSSASPPIGYFLITLGTRVRVPSRPRFFFSCLAAFTGTKALNRKMPFAAAMALAIAAETWSRITRTPSPMSVDAIRSMNAGLRVTSAKAEKQLGVSFRPFAATVADTVSWAQTKVPRESRSAPVLSASKQETV